MRCRWPVVGIGVPQPAGPCWRRDGLHYAPAITQPGGTATQEIHCTNSSTCGLLLKIGLDGLDFTQAFGDDQQIDIPVPCARMALAIAYKTIHPIS